jgi:hypothetical protein
MVWCCRVVSQATPSSCQLLVHRGRGAREGENCVLNNLAKDLSLANNPQIKH